jgi:hypothetical protein
MLWGISSALGQWPKPGQNDARVAQSPDPAAVGPQLRSTEGHAQEGDGSGAVHNPRPARRKEALVVLAGRNLPNDANVAPEESPNLNRNMDPRKTFPARQLEALALENSLSSSDHVPISGRNTPGIRRANLMGCYCIFTPSPDTTSHKFGRKAKNIVFFYWGCQWTNQWHYGLFR